MHPEAVEVLVAMGEYIGTQESFLHDSVLTLQSALQCSTEAAERIIHNLLNHGGINFDMKPGEELPLTQWLSLQRVGIGTVLRQLNGMASAFCSTATSINQHLSDYQPSAFPSQSALQ